VRVGWGGGFWPPGWKKGVHFSPRPRGGTGHSPIWGAQRTRPARHPAPPWRGPQCGSGDYPTTRPGGGVGIGPTPEKSACHWSNGFLLTSWSCPSFSSQQRSVSSAHDALPCSLADHYWCCGCDTAILAARVSLADNLGCNHGDCVGSVPEIRSAQRGIYSSRHFLPD